MSAKLYVDGFPSSLDDAELTNYSPPLEPSSPCGDLPDRQRTLRKSKWRQPKKLIKRFMRSWWLCQWQISTRLC